MSLLIKRGMLACCVVSGLFNVALAQSNNLPERFSGKAYDQKTGELAYVEEYEVSKMDPKNGRDLILTTKYYNPQKQLMAVRTAAFQNDKVVDYSLRQELNPYQEAVVRSASAIEIKREVGGKQKTKRIEKVKGDEIVDAGFATMAVRNWTSLLDGQTVKFRFVNPGTMSVVKLKVDFVGYDEIQDQKVVGLKMTAANSLISLLIKPVYVGFYENTKQLAYFRGQSNLKHANGDNYVVNIEYPYAEN